MAFLIGTPRSGLPCVDDQGDDLHVCVTIRHDPYTELNARGILILGLLF